MKRIALAGDEDRKDLFEATAAKVRMRADAVEKDFWVCYMIDHLFNHCCFKDAFVFKGGTSLSKSYHVIERFSEDIDIILDWRKVTGEESDPWEERSRTKQDQYNKRLNRRAAEFYNEELAPSLNEELEKKLGKADLVAIDDNDDMVLNFYYPQLFDVDYLRPMVRLEIGPLAEWTPSHLTEITSFSAECYPEVFEQRTTTALTVDVERTFWEKITILHKIANFTDGKVLPARYARHLYDVFAMGHSEVKEKAFSNKELLERDVIFKQKFYYSKSANYETATLNAIRLIPGSDTMESLRRDYKAMENMIYGETPEFDEIIGYLKELETEIHNLGD